MNINKLLKEKHESKTTQTDNSLPVFLNEPIIGAIRELHLDNIVENEEQSRKDYQQDKIVDLAESIKQKGLIQPIIVKPDGSKYIIISGHRRYRAFKELDRKTIPSIVKEEQYQKEELLIISLIENLQREDLNTVEISESLYKLKEFRKFNQEELAKFTGYSKANISKYIQIYGAIKNNVEKKEAAKRLGIKRAYSHFCVNSEKKNTENHLQVLHIKIKNKDDKKEIDEAIAQVEQYLIYLKEIQKVSR